MSLDPNTMDAEVSVADGDPGSPPRPSRSDGAFMPAARAIPDSAAPTRALLGFVPQLSLTERDRRWDRLRKKMIMAGLDALVFLGTDIYWGNGMANLRYVFQVDSQIAADGLFPLEGEPVVWNGPPHMNRPTSMYLSLQEWITDIRARAGMAGIAAELRARGMQSSRIGLVGFSHTLQTTTTFLHEDRQLLDRLLPDVAWVDATPMVQELRIVKSEEELQMLREAGKIARKTIDALVGAAEPGVPDAVVYAEMVRTQIANGGEPNIFNLFVAGPLEHSSDELWHLLHGCDQPLTPTMRPLEQGDLILSEFHTKYGGYRCHTEYTVYLGKTPPRQLMRLWEVSWECLEASKRALVAGRTLREAWTLIRQPAKDAGLDWVELGFHAMGLASPEWPSVVYPEGYGISTANGEGIGDLVLEEGMAFGNNIDLHDSTWKPDVGCMLADFMLVGVDEAECLVNPPRDAGGLA